MGVGSFVGTEWSSLTTATYTYPFDPWVVTYNPCSPYLSIPSNLLTLNPHWSTCWRNFEGLHDPPSVLETANGFFPVTTTAPAPKSPTETKGAAAPQAVQQTMATKTLAPNPIHSLGNDHPPGQPSQRMSKLPTVITMGETIITANSASAFRIGTQTLAPGQKITAAGTVLSMAPDGRTLFFGETSSQLLDPSYAFGIQTVSAGGPAVTVSGTVISVQPGGESAVLGGTVTQDISVLLGGGESRTATKAGGTPTSSGWSRASESTKSSSASGKIESNSWILWQVALGVVVTVSALV